MENDKNTELIESICYQLIENKMYVDLKTVETICKCLEKETCSEILKDLKYLE